MCGRMCALLALGPGGLAPYSVVSALVWFTHTQTLWMAAKEPEERCEAAVKAISS